MANLLQQTLRKSSVEEFAEKILWARVHRVHMNDWLEAYCPMSEEDEKLDDGPQYDNFVLPPNHTLQEAIDFLKSLDFEYDDGYGAQEVDGIIMFNDSTWIVRAEYDGSEWWERRRVPVWTE